jgi:hypothetical protein
MLNFYGLEIMQEVRYKRVFFCDPGSLIITCRLRLGKYTARAYPEHTSRVRRKESVRPSLLIHVRCSHRRNRTGSFVFENFTWDGDEPEFTEYNKTLIPPQIPFSTMIRGTLNLTGFPFPIPNSRFSFRPYNRRRLPTLRLRPSFNIQRIFPQSLSKFNRPFNRRSPHLVDTQHRRRRDREEMDAEAELDPGPMRRDRSRFETDI